MIFVFSHAIGLFSVSAADSQLDRAEYDNGSFSPILPIAEGRLDVSSIDYYYENKNDSLPGLHGGIDFVCASGTEIIAIEKGRVFHVGYHSDYGNNVIVEHFGENGEKYYSRYAHLNSYKVSSGDVVKQGQVLGKSGSTGMSYSPHLHLEIYTEGTMFSDRQERSYTIKYYLSQGTEILSRLRFYNQPINGTYNSQLRVKKLGSGGSCYNRCALDVKHDHISRYAEYIKLFYSLSSTGKYYVYNAQAEAGIFEDAVLRKYVYNRYDTDRDGHLSLCEAMKVKTLDLSGVGVSSLSGIHIFSNLVSVKTDGENITDALHTLSVSFKASTEYVTEAGLCGTYKHIDTKETLNMRSGPSTSYGKVGSISPLAIFVVTETACCSKYTWGKTVYNGVEGWCVISESTWTEQLSSTTHEYYVDAQGNICRAENSEKITLTTNGTESGEAIPHDLLPMLSEEERFVGWALTEGGEAKIFPDTSSLLEVFPALSYKDVSVTLYAVIGYYDVEGDLNDDGVVDSRDVGLVVSYLSGHPEEKYDVASFDVNGDGKVNNRDMLELKKLQQARS